MSLCLMYKHFGEDKVSQKKFILTFIFYFLFFEVGHI